MLILLVGANPLPNYLSVLALRPHKIVLVHSPETQPASERLALVLGKSLDPATEIARLCAADAFSATTVRNLLKQLMGDHSHHWRISLNYTGGTKVMAANALHIFYKAGGKPEDASYLDDGGSGNSPRLRFDEGTIRTLAECRTPNLTLETMLELHGARLQRCEPKQPAPAPGDVDEIAKAVLAQPELGGRLHDAVKEAFRGSDDPKRFLASPFEPARSRVAAFHRQVSHQRANSRPDGR